MNRRDFLSKIPHALAISGAGMFAAAKALDAQPEVLHAAPKADIVMWWRVGADHCWSEIRETAVCLDGTILTRVYGDTGAFEVTKEHVGFRRLAIVAERRPGIDSSVEWPILDWFPKPSNWA